MNLDALEYVLEDYLKTVVPAMLFRGYHLRLVKGGPEYAHLPEQSHLAHIVNGVFGVAQFVRFLMSRNVPVVGLGEDALRKALALYTIHEVHKDDSVDLLGSSEFSG